MQEVAESHSGEELSALRKRKRKEGEFVEGPECGEEKRRKIEEKRIRKERRRRRRRRKEKKKRWKEKEREKMRQELIAELKVMFTGGKESGCKCAVSMELNPQHLFQIDDRRVAASRVLLPGSGSAILEVASSRTLQSTISGEYMEISANSLVPLSVQTASMHIAQSASVVASLPSESFSENAPIISSPENASVPESEDLEGEEIPSPDLGWNETVTCSSEQCLHDHSGLSCLLSHNRFAFAVCFHKT